MKMLRLSAMLAVVFLSPTAAGASLSPEEAMKHVGENVTVCGVVASAYYAARSKSQPTSLELDKPYPNQVFTAVIFGKDRRKLAHRRRRFWGSMCASRATSEFTEASPG